MDVDDRIVQWLQWVYAQGYELVNRDLIEKSDPILNARIHLYCLDESEVMEEVDTWRRKMGEPPLFGPDAPDVALTA